MLKINKELPEERTIPRGIRQVNGGKWKWEVMVSGKRRSGTCATLDEAITARAEAQGEMIKLPYPDRHKPIEAHYTPTKTEEQGRYCPTLKQAFEQMMRADWSNAKSKKSIIHNCRTALEFYGPNMKLDALDTAAIDAYVSYLREHGNAQGTINRKLSVVSKLLTRAYEKGIIDKRPYIERQPEPEGRIRFITPEEEEKLLGLFAKWKEWRFYHVVRILIDTGMRCGELKKLTIYDIQPEQGAHGVVYLNETKNGTSRSIPLTQRAFESLAYLAKTSKDHERLICEYESWITKQWNRARRAMNKTKDPNFVPHILRHTCCTRLMQKGAPVKKVQLFMGHKSINTTMRYTHLFPQDIFDLPSLLEKSEKS